MSKKERLFKKFLKTFPYYILATAAKIKPFTIKFKTLWGDNMYGDLPNANTFIYYGCAEANLTNFIIRNLKENEIFIDGGANIGFYSLLSSALVGEKGSVHSFEPTPKTFKLLKKNSLQKKNIKINQLAILDKETEIDFIDYGIGYNAFNSINKRLNIKEIEGLEQKIRVQTTTIDTYCEVENIKPNFIKLDLEGSEYLALEGSVKVLKEIRPILSIEVAGDKEWINNIKIVNNTLQKNNYLPFLIKNNGYLEKHTVENSYKYDNLIYIPKEKINKYYDNH
ncbi:FkbM family methyltransferase [Candidatus Gracilibacteria bacterium]|nr:FkbM family methyltransferase [Candidatus Gracilibacteria bacterium]